MKHPDRLLLLLGLWGTREAIRERDLVLAARCIAGATLAAFLIGAAEFHSLVVPKAP